MAKKNQLMLPTWVVMSMIAALTSINLGGAITSYYYSRVSRTAASTRQPLSTDQVLAALSTTVTVLGGIVAVATVVIALAALYGYAELRTATVRKTEEDLRSIIGVLQRNGDLSAAQASVLLESVDSSRSAFSANSSRSAGIAVDTGVDMQNTGTKVSRPVKQDEKLADDYPGSGQT